MAGFADDKFDVYRPELWISRIHQFMKEKFYAATFFDDYSGEISGTDLIHIPHISDTFSATSIPVTSGAIDGTDISETKTDLTIDVWKGAAYFITKFEEREIMMRATVRDKYKMAMGYRLGRDYERDILANALGIANVPARAGLTTTQLVATNLEYAMSVLASNSVPKDECRIFMDPKQYWSQLMSIQKYYDASQFGRPTVPTGAHDMLYGVPIVLTPNVSKETGMSAYSGTIIHPTAIAHARAGVGFTQKPSENLRTKLIADIIYGDTLKDGKRGVRLLGTSL